MVESVRKDVEHGEFNVSVIVRDGSYFACVTSLSHRKHCQLSVHCPPPSHSASLPPPPRLDMPTGSWISTGGRLGQKEWTTAAAEDMSMISFATDTSRPRRLDGALGGLVHGNGLPFPTRDNQTMTYFALMHELQIHYYMKQPPHPVAWAT